MKKLALASVVIASLSLASAARANGKFPAAGQIVIDPGDAMHVVVRTTFGILVSHDGGASFDWICESAAHYGNGLDPGIAITGDGSLLVATDTGVSVGRGTFCDFDLASDVGSQFIADVSALGSDPKRAYALLLNVSGTSDVWATSDNASTWSKAGTIPSGFIPVTLDVAASNAMRIYASGIHQGDAGGYVAAMARSDDGGATFSFTDLPSAYAMAEPYLAAIDPTNADRVYVRTDETPGHLLVSSDGAATWQVAFQGNGSLEAFALSPDGKTALVGGPTDGVWRASTTTLDFVQTATIPATCFNWSTSRVYACVDAMVDPALNLVAASDDQGSTFTSVLELPCVRGPLACPASTSVEESCPSEWPAIAMQISAVACPTGSDAGPSATATATSSDVSATTSSTTSAGGASASSSSANAATPASSGSGCGCEADTRTSAPVAVASALAALALIVTRRRRR